MKTPSYKKQVTTLKAILYRVSILTTLCYTAGIFIYSVGWPWAESFPLDLKKLHGKIKFIAAYNYAITRDSFGFRKAIVSDKSYISFHPSGNTIISERYGSRGSITEYYCTYDHRGQMSEMDIIESINESIDTKKVVTHQYDIQNREIHSFRIYSELNDTQFIKYTYLEGGNKVIKHTQSSYTNPKTKFTTVDSNNETMNYDYKQHVESSSDFTYQMKGENIEKTELLYDSRRIILYNKKMDEIQGDYYQISDGTHSKKISLYDEHDNLISWVGYKNDTFVNKQFHHYIYDHTGNWTTDSIFEKDSLFRIMTRRIEYY